MVHIDLTWVFAVALYSKQHKRRLKYDHVSLMASIARLYTHQNWSHYESSERGSGHECRVWLQQITTVCESLQSHLFNTRQYANLICALHWALWSGRPWLQYHSSAMLTFADLFACMICSTKKHSRCIEGVCKCLGEGKSVEYSRCRSHGCRLLAVKVIRNPIIDHE